MIIKVSGRAERAVPPDLGVTHLRVEFSGPDKADVLAKTHETANWLAEQIDQLPADEIVRFTSDGVSSYSYSPHEKKKQAVVYEASCSFVVTFKDLAALSQRTASWSAVEGINHRWTDWDLTDERKAEVLAELLGEALDAAHRKAAAIAKHLGVGTPRVVEVRESPGSSHVAEGRMLYAAAAVGGAAFEARPDDLDLAHSIDVIFDAES